MIKLPYAVAESICEMECICIGEGIGPDISVLMIWIGLEYPELKEKYSHLQWSQYVKSVKVKP